MNSEEVDKASTKFAERLQKESGGNMGAAVNLAYEITGGRTPSRMRLGVELCEGRSRQAERPNLDALQLGRNCLCG